MQRRLVWLLLGLLCIGGLAYLWRAGEQRQQDKTTSQVASKGQSQTAAARKTQVPSPFLLLSQSVAAKAAQKATNSSRYPYRLSNTTKTVNQLAKSETGILMANALIDTADSTKLAIPQHLRAPANNGSYIVQARGAIDNSFRSTLQSAGAEIVSYVPNNAYLVRMSDSEAATLRGNSSVQSVLNYEPYYKLEPGLLKFAVEQTPLPEGTELKLTLYPNTPEAALAPLRKLNIKITAEERSPFGQVVTVRVPANALVDLAVDPAIEAVQRSYSRTTANDLSRTTLQVSENTVTNINYLGLTGSNILININDTGVDMGHFDLTNRVFGDFTNSLFDTVGHGTHVAGSIAGSGAMSLTISNVPQGSVKNANFRGMAPGAKLYVLSLGDSDTYLQEHAALTNAEISNNSWAYANAFEYNIEAASYDAAVRDALPAVKGSQPVLFVFSAGNSGGGEDTGLNGDADSILSPGTAKNVITVGAIEQKRNITNDVYFNGETTKLFQGITDSKDQVAGFSSRGNVGIGLEGDFGRFKPDVVAPGTFVISTRSSQWDTNAYYNPTSHFYNVFSDQSVDPNELTLLPPIFIPDNAVGLNIRLLPNGFSPSPFPAAPIYLKYGRPPTLQAFDLRQTNLISLPQDLPPLRNGELLFYGVGAATNETLNFNVETELLLTNDYGTYYTVLSNLNNDLAPYYRYESGTSMSAAGISGMLGLMQEFFEQRLHMTNSPALMKALLINGARPAGADYDTQVRNSINYQGWGLANLTNSIPKGLTNFVDKSGSISNSPVLIFDQSPTNALATGQRKTVNIRLTAQAAARPLRATLVWTDPPGNPIVGIKLVNDLDLIVTNLDTGDVFYGNDIQGGADFNQPWDTNTAPNLDFINNVENVYLAAPLGTNYSITVVGRRVNVNAPTGNTNDIVQDYALVVSSGNGDVTNALTYSDGPKQTNIVSNTTTVTNGVPILYQRVGGNSQYAATTNGSRGQWNFYIYTNTNSYTNVAFVTFLPPEIGLTRTGTRESDIGTAGRAEADIDMYVSTDPDLLNLTTAAVNGAFKSSTRTGTEKVLLTNSSLGQTYYIGIKSEDQQGAEYSFLAVASLFPFDQRDGNGNIKVTMLTSFPVNIPDGSPGKPGHATYIGVSTAPDAVRRVIVTNEVTHQNFGDTLGTLSHGRKLVALNNHTYFDNPTSVNQRFIYDDSGQNDIPGSKHTDGPGTLQTFIGDKAIDGVWIVTMVDDALTQTGRVDFTGITLEPKSPTNNFTTTLGANSYWFDFIDVPPNATNLTVKLAITGPNGLELMIRRGNLPTRTVYDKKAFIAAPGGQLSMTVYDSPPLNPGRYYIAVYNPNGVPVTFNISENLYYGLYPIKPYTFLSPSDQPLLDDAITYSTNFVGIHSHVVSAEVGVRIDHPRISDLVLTLISPQGTRVLLAENRGRLDSHGYGAGVNITNVYQPFNSGNALAQTNPIPVNQNAGTLLINYDFFTVPDTMHIYYDGIRIFDSGYVNGAGQFVIDYGPGISSNLFIVMNEGNNANQSTAWTYSLTAITRTATYAFFTEDTNYTTMPIKFAVPPFGSTNVTLPASNIFNLSFEGIAPGNYTAPTTVDGWTLSNTTNPVAVVAVPSLADTGTNILAVHSNSLSRILPTVGGRDYRLQFVSRGQPALTPISWWRAESNYLDSAGGGNDATVTAGSVGFAPGVVGSAFNIPNAMLRVVGDPANLRLTNNFSIESWLYSSNLPGPQGIFYRSDSRPGYDPYTVSIAPSLTPGFGDLSFSVTSSNNQSFWITAPFPLNQFAHMACTYSNGLMSLYINGQLSAQSNTTVVPLEVLQLGSDPGVGIGNVGDGSYNAPFVGLIDEMTVYGQVLSATQIQSIYAAGSAGKCPVFGGCTVTADVVLAGNTNTIGAADSWVTNTFTFTAPSNNMLLEILPHGNGLLVDSFQLIQNPIQNPTNYFLPEESLDKLLGENSYGDWKLEILDNRVGATNPPATLVSWQLSLLLDSVTPLATPLSHGIPGTNSVNSGEIKYFSVDVPLWAKYATNILLWADGGVNVLFNQNGLPNAGDIQLIGFNVMSGINTLDTIASNPQLIPGERYYLGVQNLGSAVVNFAIEVDFDITPLTNAVPVTNTLASVGQPRYYFYDVSTNAVVTDFDLYNLSGNVDLVVRKGLPLPDTINYDYLSSNLGTNPETIVIATNSFPLVLTPGRWYLGVFNNDLLPVTYTIRALEAGAPTIIDLTNNIPLTYQSVPGPALNTFFHFKIDQTNAAALFELYNLGGNVDLTLQSNSLPYSPPFASASVYPGTNNEQIVIRTNVLLAPINADWYLGVPNNEITNVTFTIRAVVSTNGLLVSDVPINVGITVPPPGSTNGPTLVWPAVDGELYGVETTTNLFATPIPWTVISTNVYGGGTSAAFLDPTPITGVPALFYQIFQIPQP